MTVLAATGFETGNTDEIYTSGGIYSANASVKATGGYSLRITGPSGGEWCGLYGGDGIQVQDLGHGTRYIQARLYVATLPASFVARILFTGNNANGASSTPIAATYIQPDGTLKLAGATNSSTIAISTGVWHTLKIKLVPNGTCTLSVDGGTEVTCTGNNVLSNYFHLNYQTSPDATLTFYLDDVVISDAEITDGQCLVGLMAPTANGNYTGWTASAGNKWDCVDEVPPSGTDYISSGTGAGDQRYSPQHATMSSLGASASASVKHVRTIAKMREATSTTTLGAVGVYSSGSVAEATAVDLGGTTEILFLKEQPTNPNGGGAWTVSAVNSAEPVVKRSTSDTSDIRCTALYLGVVWVEPPVDITSSENAAVNVTESPGIAAALTSPGENAGINVTESPDVVITEDVASAENSAANVTESDTLDIEVGIDTAENAAANVTEDAAVDASVDTAENAGVNVTESLDLVADLQVPTNAGVNVTEDDSIAVIGDFPPRRIRLDVYSPAGAKLGAGPIVTALEANYDEEVDTIGTWSVAVPATDARAAALLTHGNEVKIFRESEGFVFWGTVDQLRHSDAADGTKVLIAGGFGVDRQLARADTLPGREFAGVAASSVLSTLVGLVTSWAAGTAAALTLTFRPESMSVFAALGEAAKIMGAHVRTDTRTKVVDLDTLGDASGLVFSNVGNLPVRRTYRSLYEITEFVIEEESSELWNEVILFGAGEGVAALTLAESTRSTPYTIQSDVGPDGRTFYYLQDAASVALYGSRRTTRRVQSIAPLANTAAARVEASNTLYDVGAAWLQRVAQVNGRYGFRAAGLKHINPLTGAAYFKVGQKVRVVYRGVAVDRAGNRTSYRKIDGQQWLMGLRRTFNRDGSDTFDLRCATVDRDQDNPDTVLSDAIQAIRGLSAGLKPYVANLYSMGRGSVDTSHPLDFLVDYDDNVQFVIQAKVRWELKKVRTNATGVASGGGSTSGAGSSHSHSVSGQTASSGGGSTSGAGASHSHSVSGGATGTESAFTSVDGSHNGIGPSPASTQAESGGHAHNETGTTTGTNLSSHTHSLNSHTHDVGFNLAVAAQNHTHNVTGGTSGAESTHTHTTPNHTHSVTGATSSADTTHTHTTPDHTHALSFGIYEGSSPATPSIHLYINGTDRSAALGGPWNTTPVEVDVTDYLTDPANPGQPLRQSNVVRFTSSELLDVDAVVRSLVTASAIAPT